MPPLSRIFDWLIGRTYSYLPDRAKHYAARRARRFAWDQQIDELSAQLGATSVVEDLALLRTVASMRAIVKASPTICIDVGAHKGDFARLAADVFSFRKIVCIEPNVDLVAAIGSRFRPEELVVHCAAVSNSPGEMTLFVHGEPSMSSLLPANHDTLREKFPGDDPSRITRRTVPVSTLDELLRDELRNEANRFLVKIDTQGNELDVLEGARMTMQKTDAALVEYMFCSPYERRGSLEQLMKRMTDCGFHCTGVLDVKRRPTHEISGVDFLFCP